MHKVYKNITERCCNELKKTQETQEAQNIRNNELSSNSSGKTKKFQEDVYYNSSKKFLSYHDAPLPSSPISSMVSRDPIKETSAQRRSKLHKGPLILPEENL